MKTCFPLWDHHMSLDQDLGLGRCLMGEWSGLQPSPCFSNFLARTTFVLESLREAKNPGQDAFFWDLRSFLSNFWGFTHFIVDASVLSPHESSA